MKGTKIKYNSWEYAPQMAFKRDIVVFDTLEDDSCLNCYDGTLKREGKEFICTHCFKIYTILEEKPNIYKMLWG